MNEDELLQVMVIDLRRGTLVLAVLSRLKKPKYGYSLLQDMEEQGIRIEVNTLYPMLRRLESQGLLRSKWDTAKSRPRKYYEMSDRGHELFSQLKDEWRRMTSEMKKMLKESEKK
jgi:DNA-binding PadR family transcriptional regulator